jgi:hypothetical protein
MTYQGPYERAQNSTASIILWDSTKSSKGCCLGHFPQCVWAMFFLWGAQYHISLQQNRACSSCPGSSSSFLGFNSGISPLQCLSPGGCFGYKIVPEHSVSTVGKAKPGPSWARVIGMVFLSQQWLWEDNQCPVVVVGTQSNGPWVGGMDGYWESGMSKLITFILQAWAVCPVLAYSSTDKWSAIFSLHPGIRRPEFSRSGLLCFSQRLRCSSWSS